jgi:hypothetical protein
LALRRLNTCPRLTLTPIDDSPMAFQDLTM